MGNCLITVHVTGAHHNGKSFDIDQAAARFVDHLRTMGHNVTAAHIVSGVEHDLLNTAARYPVSAIGWPNAVASDLTG